MTDILVGVGVGGSLVAVAVFLVLLSMRPPRPFVVQNGSMIAEFLEYYSKKSGLDIDSICLVATDIDEETTVYHVKSIDMFPELWV